ncbi:serine/threonine-protein kinase DCLK1-like isoform X4 [Amphibalanus amphitrite]|uniref:serine/threonine-protein kinase DCLK1-like isoform X4 n=1 Tax=Amphibalanus amphitrite TaxID=1232801 RepID=UPI001C905602|nr:serine/threonine-protein kinase DCLK1-like isoform X4 [Amphibalanus amphitrite]
MPVLSLRRSPSSASALVKCLLTMSVARVKSRTLCLVRRPAGRRRCRVRWAPSSDRLVQGRPLRTDQQAAGKLSWRGAEMVAGDTNGYGSEEHGDTGGDSTPRLSPAGQQTPTGASTRTSLVKMSADKRAKKVRFYRNGDRFFKGLAFAVPPDRYRTFDSLLADLTRSSVVSRAALPMGVRVIFTLDGMKVNSLDDILEGQNYVCSSTDTFKKLDYLGSQDPTWNTRRGQPSPAHTPPQHSGSAQDMQTESSERMTAGGGSRDFIHPKLITVIRSGTRPRRLVRMLLNKKTAHSFEQVLQELSRAVKLDSGVVRKIFTVEGRQIRELEDFFDNDSLFIAYGHEKHRPDDFDLHPDEMKWLIGQAGSKHVLEPGTEHPSAFRSSSGRRAVSARAPGGRASMAGPAGAPDGYSTLATPRARRRLRAKSPFLASGQTNGAAPPPSESGVDCPARVREKYWVGRKIGDGNFAVVCECVHRSSGAEHALKAIDKSKCRGKEQMIENEVSILRRVHHPNIIQLVEEFDFPAELYLVMELVKGGDLFDAISTTTKYTEKDASNMVRDLASALSYLHHLDIVHRDIKPENLLLVERPGGVKSLKLGDFGLAQEVTGPLYAVCGTPTYVAPEILSGVGYGVKVDIWAAGVITYILLCGFPPFASADNNQEELFDRILSGEFEFTPPFWDDVSDAARELITAMLQVEPDARFSAEEVLIHPWIAEDEALENDMHLTVAHKLGIHFDTESSRHKNAGVNLLTTALDKEDELFLGSCLLDGALG